ncbi:uncharacterized protein LOC117787903 [Drosophila innubila]|uniref:uncharacterized protein LOC117787903 n=1 Tax=Drosophila innubila TaxID=198719 RepID=UPI00148C0D00|nr:uncharacterized protein LOC117787903 [Drosophila innubila]
MANMEQLLEEVKTNVQQKFNEIRAALHMREKLLLRQLEVIANTQQQQQQPVYIENNANESENCKVRFFTGDNGEEEKLLLAIRSFGQFQLDSSMQLALHRTQDNMTAGLRNEDYIEPMDDHETMYKCLEDRDQDDEEIQPEAIVVDFSRSKALLEDNAKRSIINITLQEAKDLIRRAKIKRETYVPPLNLEELDDELESSIADAVSSLGRSCSDQQPASKSKPKARKPRLKPKITINNCNGTINLRNIASLTINCASEDAVSAELPLTEAPKLSMGSSSSSNNTEQSSCSPSSSNYSSNASSRSQSKKQKMPKRTEGKREQHVASSSTNTNTTDTHDVTCDFYNRLLNEIKKSLKEKPTRVLEVPGTTNTTTTVTTAETTTTTTATVTSSINLPGATVTADSSCDATNYNKQASSRDAESTISSQLQPGKRLILKNFENLKIILEANSGDEDAFHPVQIEQWLAEIISETDLEPMQNTDILEHSKIDNSESN